MVQGQDQNIVIGKKHNIRSKILGEERPYWIYLPASHKDSAFEPQRYPVLYLLDGNAYFHIVSGIVQFMSTSINMNNQIPELIIVAIPNTNRMRDLTPTHSKIGVDGKETTALESSGGGNTFLKFLQEELFPHIDTTYRTLPHHIIVGHSAGGTLALHALLDAPEIFQSYIAIDPNISWDNQVLVHRVKRLTQEAQTRQGAVHISMGNSPDIGTYDPIAIKKTVQTFADNLALIHGAEFRSALQYFETDDHASIPLPGLYYGLLYIFEGYKPSFPDLIREPSTLITHFANISKKMGINLRPPAPYVHQAGYHLLNQIRDADKAIELFKTNITNFPDWYLSYDGLGEAYTAKNEKYLAIASYEKSLERNPTNNRARQQLQTLKTQKGSS